MARPKDYLGRPLRVGDVVVYAVLIGRLAGGQPLRRGVVLTFEESYAWIRMLPDGAEGRPSTVRIHQDRVLLMPTALSAPRRPGCGRTCSAYARRVGGPCAASRGDRRGPRSRTNFWSPGPPLPSKHSPRRASTTRAKSNTSGR